MSDKIALVFDTNFVIAKINILTDVCHKLSEIYNIYITDVSIQERISQKYIEMKDRYTQIDKFITEYSDLVEINIKKTFDEKYEIRKNKVIKSYQELFGKNIIKFNPKSDTLNILMDRVYKKTPPFSNNGKESDKGFKDTLIWLSILEHFYNNGEEKIIFVTDDKGFRSNSNILCEEFCNYTGKVIEIVENNFYEKITENTEDIQEIEPKPLPEVNLLREKIHETISALRYIIVDYDDWGNPEYCKTFILQNKVTADDVQKVFTHLRKIIEDNLFEKAIPADKVFNLNITNSIPILIDDLQKALNLYENICKECKEYLPQFFNTVANIFNINYIDPKSDDGSDCPF